MVEREWTSSDPLGVCQRSVCPAAGNQEGLNGHNAPLTTARTSPELTAERCSTGGAYLHAVANVHFARIPS